ncbi:helix-turn-helix transcriptional regulator [Staphylococcus haemolyticus]|uniref:helix-turn-helix transcriptional regulator n=1 Tax=Staphylococcus haemolyticus TaxID=1283 RepID=UPI00069DDEA1|nr:helix-turn-helix transcriptional regulator [Staphylococcus haemolyticus]
MKSRMITYEDRMHIARRINTLRLDAELSQIEFGKRLGVGRLAVCRWENRAQLPPMKTIRRMAEEFNTTPEWILYGE